MELEKRIIMFYEFCIRNNLDGGISYFEKEFHVTVTNSGKIYSSGQASILAEALDECSEGFQNIGLS